MIVGAARILIVEDEILTGIYTKLLLENAGYQVVGVEMGGEEAIANAARNHPDLALIDINLRGGMNGIEAAKIIRERYAIPSLFLTAYAAEEVMEKNRELKASEIITKPLQAEQLRDRVESILNKGRGYRNST